MIPPVRRELWADSARGLAIIAVVLGHVFLQEDAAAQWSMWHPAQAAWTELRDLLLPVRMPLFFLIAGYFASRVIRRPWGTVLRTRTFGLYYLYVVWLLAQTVFFLFVPHDGTAAATTARELAAQLTYAPTNLWFLVALAVYFVVAKAGVRVAPVALGAAAWLSWSAFADRLPDIFDRTPMPEYLVFFLVGAYAPALLRSIRGSVWLTTAGMLGLSAGVAAMRDADDRMLWTTWLTLSTVAGVTAVVSLLKLLEANGLLPQLTVWIGRRTLPIYVAQLPLAVAVEALIDLLPPGVAQTLLGNPLVSTVYPLLVTAAIVGAGLLLHAAVGRVAPWMYRAPWLQRETSPAAVALIPVGVR
ncbi:acyltransferase family protein [Microbacterium sp. P06]|uniref:acyltransferase family protein n=1 Tax=Microbacterium sp. P06 TaxID=3366949 RepID=UPI00374563FB